MRTIGTAMGLVMMIIGIVLAILGIGSFVSLASSPHPGTEGFGVMGTMIAGFLLLVFGLMVMYFSNLQKIASFYARQAAPAMQTASSAIARGIQESGGLRVNVPQGTAPVQQVVRIRCRRCGYLETEDAKFCSNCGNPP